MSMHPGRDLSAAPNVPPPLLLPSQLPAAPTTALGGVDGEQLWLWGMDGLVWRIQGPRRGGHVVEGRPVPRWVGEQGVNGGPHGFPERAQSLDMERESGWRVLPFGLLRSASLGQEPQKHQQQADGTCHFLLHPPQPHSWTFHPNGLQTSASPSEVQVSKDHHTG